MRLDSNDGEAWIELTVREIVSDHPPSVCFAVEISAYGWETYDEEMWVEVLTWPDFRVSWKPSIVHEKAQFLSKA